MSQYNEQENQGFYGGNYGWSSNPPEGYSFDMTGADFGAEQQFGAFDYSNPTPATQQHGPYDNNPYLQPQGGRYTGSIMTPQPSYDSGTANFEDEPPLMEELGINFDHIMQKVWNN